MSVKADRIPPPLKWHGGKHDLAARIVAIKPVHPLRRARPVEAAKRQAILRFSLVKSIPQHSFREIF